MSKKITLSPLMTAILLITFSIALAAIIMRWGENYVDENAEFVKGASEVFRDCDLVDFFIVKIGDSQKICQQENKLVMWLDNGPRVDLYNVFVRIIGENDVMTGNLLEIPLKKNSAVKTELSLNGLVHDVKLIPEIVRSNEVIMCSEKAIEVKSVPLC